MNIVERCACGGSLEIVDTLLLVTARQLVEGFRAEHRACREPQPTRHGYESPFRRPALEDSEPGLLGVKEIPGDPLS